MKKPEEAQIPDPGVIRTEGEALDQSIALNRIVMTMLQHQKESNKRLFIALILSILVNVFVVAGFLYYESQWEYTDTVTTTIQQEVDGEGSNINNVQGDQYNDNATHNEGGVE